MSDDEPCVCGTDFTCMADEHDGDLAGAIVRTMHLVPPSADEVRVAVGDVDAPSPTPWACICGSGDDGEWHSLMCVASNTPDDEWRP